ncbi:MAG: hypothetical protein ACD_5C00016G0012 [uncultured bacterium]|nr:MAG: hypothetical protein ACD_5C00016G0012 [uncultured bacterium]
MKRVMTEEHKRKISLAKMGKKRPKEMVERVAAKLRGKKRTEEVKKKLSEIHKKIGSGKWMIGRKMTEENKAKIREANLGRKCSNETKKKIGEKNKIAHIGKKRTKEHIKNLSESHKGAKAYNFNPTSPAKKLIRKSYKFRKWCSDIFRRDNNQCVLCNNKSIQLEVDHYPVYFSTIIDDLARKQGLDNLFEKAMNHELLWDMNNGRTLCRECHQKTENYPKNFIKNLNFVR